MWRRDSAGGPGGGRVAPDAPLAGAHARAAGRPLAAAAGIAAVDQALLSALSFAVALALIRFAPKSEFGVYSVLLTLVVLAQSLQNAFVLAPMQTLAPQRSGADQERFLGELLRANLAGALVAAAIACAGVAAFARIESVAAIAGGAALAVGAAIVGALSRDALRTALFVRHRPAAALRLDALYACAVAGGLGLLVVADRVSAAGVLGVLGGAGVAVALVAWRIHRIAGATGPGRRMRAETGEAIWSCARWGLWSLPITWLYSSSYVYFLGTFAGVDTVADVSAARILLMPVAVMMAAWAAAFRPRASAWVAEGHVNVLRWHATRSVAIAFVVIALYTLVIVGLFGLVQPLVLGPKYAGLDSLVACWGAFFLCSAMATVGSCYMLSDPAGYRPLSLYTWLAYSCSLPLTGLAAWLDSPDAAVLSMALAEGLVAGQVWLRGRRLIATSHGHR